MARAHFVKKARKAYRADGIKKGQSYYWWKFNFGPKIRSKTQPRPSQLTRSEFLGDLYDIQDDIEALTAGPELASEVEEIAGRLRELGDRCRDNRDNMPEALQDSETGELLEARSEACEAAADELEAIDCEYDEPDDDDEDAEEDPEQAHWDRVLKEVQGVSTDIE